MTPSRSRSSLSSDLSRRRSGSYNVLSSSSGSGAVLAGGGAALDSTVVGLSTVAGAEAAGAGSGSRWITVAAGNVGSAGRRSTGAEATGIDDGLSERWTPSGPGRATGGHPTDAGAEPDP